MDIRYIIVLRIIGKLVKLNKVSIIKTVLNGGNPKQEEGVDIQNVILCEYQLSTIKQMHNYTIYLT